MPRSTVADRSQRSGLSKKPRPLRVRPLLCALSSTRISAPYDPGRHHRQRQGAQGARRAAHAARAFPARASQSHRNARRLRHEPMRRVHGARRRQEREVVHDLRGAGRRLVGDDDRRPRAGRPAASGAAGLLGRARPAVRLLHAGHDHVRGQPAAGQSVAERDSRFATASPATSAAAPAISTSSTPSSTPRSTAAERR